jgi:hypothetical protein
MVAVDEEYAMSDACDDTKAGIIAQIPGIGTLLIDGNHRHYKAWKNGKESFPVHVLTEEESKQVCYTRDVWRHLVKKVAKEKVNS